MTTAWERGGFYGLIAACKFRCNSDDRLGMLTLESDLEEFTTEKNYFWLFQ
jgi:hypothetical protein